MQSLWPRVSAPARDPSPRRWVRAAVAMAAVVLVGVGLFSLWNAGLLAPGSAPGAIAALHYETHHGEQMSLRLTDDSVLHLNTDSAVTIRYGKTERLVELTSGEADFEVAHDPQRAFRVSAGSARSSRSAPSSTCACSPTRPSSPWSRGASPSGCRARTETLHAGQCSSGPTSRSGWPRARGRRRTVKRRCARSTAWLHRQIVFDQRTARSEWRANSTATRRNPSRSSTPALRSLEISGVFATDDTEAFMAFLRSLQGCAGRGDRDTDSGVDRGADVPFMYCRPALGYLAKARQDASTGAAWALARVIHQRHGSLTAVSGVLRALSVCTAGGSLPCAARAGADRRAQPAAGRRHSRPDLCRRRWRRSRSQTGLQLVYVSDVVRNQKSHAAAAGLSAAGRSARLLQGTGLRFEYLTPHSVRILESGPGAAGRAAAAETD